MPEQTFNDLSTLAQHLRDELDPNQANPDCLRGRFLAAA
jgi:hypothetical protein